LEDVDLTANYNQEQNRFRREENLRIQQEARDIRRANSKVPCGRSWFIQLIEFGYFLLDLTKSFERLSNTEFFSRGEGIAWNFLGVGANNLKAPKFFLKNPNSLSFHQGSRDPATPKGTHKLELL
jgi:hypothetical protein